MGTGLGKNPSGLSLPQLSQKCLARNSILIEIILVIFGVLENIWKENSRKLISVKL